MAVNFHVPAASERTFTHDAQAGSGADADIQQLTCQILVGKPLDGAGHTYDKIRRDSAVKKWHGVAFC